jgi:chemotaxis protein histidine kinase CheA
MFAGAAILSSGRVGLIINVESMLDTLRDSIAAAAEVNTKRTHFPAAALN